MCHSHICHNLVVSSAKCDELARATSHVIILLSRIYKFAIFRWPFNIIKEPLKTLRIPPPINLYPWEFNVLRDIRFLFSSWTYLTLLRVRTLPSNILMETFPIPSTFQDELFLIKMMSTVDEISEVNASRLKHMWKVQAESRTHSPDALDSHYAMARICQNQEMGLYLQQVDHTR